MQILRICNKKKGQPLLSFSGGVFFQGLASEIVK